MPALHGFEHRRDACAEGRFRKGDPPGRPYTNRVLAVQEAGAAGPGFNSFPSCTWERLVNAKLSLAEKAFPATARERGDRHG